MLTHRIAPDSGEYSLPQRAHFISLRNDVIQLFPNLTSRIFGSPNEAARRTHTHTLALGLNAVMYYDFDEHLIL
jgi:hypothetical protein